MATRQRLRNSLDIRIAIIGNAECGKTTTLNALLKENYSSAVMSKRSAAVGCIACYNVQVGGSNENEESPIAAINMVEETTVQYNGEDVKTVTYEVDTQEEMVSMRKDTQLTFILIPGALEGSTKYHSYIVDQWDTFDAVIVVLDGKAGIQDDDVKLLKLVQQKFKEREIPALVLCNKIDNPEDEKLVKHANKAQSKVRKIFGIDSESKERSNPVFIPCSALHAYIYRAGARLTVYQFEDFDRDLMEVIGKEHIGSKNWKNMTHEERFRKTHAILADPKKFQEGMDDCGFTTVMTELNHHLGGAEKQEVIIQKQIDLTLSKITPMQSEWISQTILGVHQKQIVFAGGSVESSDPSQIRLREVFWTTFEEFQKQTFQKFVDTFPGNLPLVANPLQELIYYHKMVTRAKWMEEEQVIFARMKEFGRYYLKFLIKRESETNNPSKWSVACKVSPLDWHLIMRSIGLLSYDKLSCESFGPELIHCMDVAQETNMWKFNGFIGADKHCPHCAEKLDLTKVKPHLPRCKPCTLVFSNDAKTTTCGYCGHDKMVAETSQCTNCKYKREELPNLSKWIKVKYDADGNPTPVDAEKYKKVIHLEVPQSLEDPSHFGHPLYKMSSFISSKSSA
jgi:GTP-binding protein EngB required for normal cell division